MQRFHSFCSLFSSLSVRVGPLCGGGPGVILQRSLHPLSGPEL
jgi:hypothetical protein